jgi:hypothetical protein
MRKTHFKHSTIKCDQFYFREHSTDNIILHIMKTKFKF